MDTHQRVFSEVAMIKKGYSLPNMIIPNQSIYGRIGDGINYDGLGKEKSKYQANLNTIVASNFANVLTRKGKLRNTI